MIEQYLAKIDEVINNGEYKDDWQSLAKYPIPQWYKDAKFGAFIHWGAYTVPAYFSEWYVRLMHYKCNPVYWHHNKKYGKDYPYTNFIEQFTAPKFNADEWVSLLKNAGMKYIMPVGEHHDGYKMYDSDLSRWTTVKQAMHRDVLGEIKAACLSQDVVFATSSHRAENFWFVNGARTLGYDVPALAPENADLYGAKCNVNKANNLITLLKQEKDITPTKEWLEDWLVNSCELIDKYRPATLFFDWWVMNHAFRPYMKKFLAYFYNRSIEWGMGVCVQYKSDAIMYNVGIFDRERGQLSGVSPYVWQSETSTAYNAWSYCTTNRWKSPQEIACVFADVISKNGNFVLNIGPKADGTICDEEKHILSELGKWTAINKPAIWGSQPYKVYGEGRKKKAGSFKERNKYTSKDFRYTYSTSHIYAFALKQSKHGVYYMSKLAQDRDSFCFDVQCIKVLGYNNRVSWTLCKQYLEVVVEGNIDTDMPICFDIRVD